MSSFLSARVLQVQHLASCLPSSVSAFNESGVRERHIPDSVEWLCDEFFSKCKSLARVTFSDSSSLKVIGAWYSMNLA